MSWISALSTTQWLVLLSVPPLVFFLYFLKLRRQPLEVPSTYLWRRAIEDMRVNSLWQRLRRNLLLLLQLLFLAALILACLRPGIHGNQATGRRWILLIDNSASMFASDAAPSRLEAAKEKAREQVRQMNRGDVAMVVAFSDRADIQQGFTGDRRRLMTAIDRIQGTNRPTEISEALRASAGLANPGRVSFDGMNDIQVAEALPATVYVYSDGGFPPLAEFDLGNLSIEYGPIGNAKIDNVAIEAFAVSRNDEGNEELEAYARIANHSDAEIETTASLYLDDKLIDAIETTIGPHQDHGARFSLEGISIDSGAFRVAIDRQDQLAVDNQAFAALRPRRIVQVLLITPGNSVLENALSTSSLQSLAQVRVESPTVLALEASHPSKVDMEVFDLVIFDQCRPQQMPPTNTLFIGEAPPTDEWKMGELTGPVQLVDVERNHPITAFLELGNIRIVEGQAIEIPEAGQTLIRADNGPIFAIAPRGPYQDAVLGFELVRITDGEPVMNTDWGIRRSFPVFVFGCVEFLSGGSLQSAASSVQPGQPMALSVSSRLNRFQVVDPNGVAVEVDRSESGQIIWTNTESLGVYQILGEERERPLATFAVNLFSSRESNLAVQSDLFVGDEKVVANTATSRGRREYWRWFLLAGFGLLICEWVIYNRRVFI